MHGAIRVAPVAPTSSKAFHSHSLGPWMLSAAVRTCCSSDALSYLASLGIAADQDLACYWVTSGELEVGVPELLRGEILRAWKLANLQFEVHLERDHELVTGCCEPSCGRPKGEFMPLFTKLLDKLSDSRLCGILACFRRWLKYHARSCPSDMPYWRPSAMVFAQFLQFVSRGGPTAAVNVYHAFKWVRSVLGVPFPMDDPLVAMWASGQGGHAAKQRTPIEIAIFVQMCERLKTSTGTVKAFLAWTLLFTTACLRFAHLQRSRDLKCDGRLLLAYCIKGKRRVQGVQQPFHWSCPAVPARGVDLAAVILLESCRPVLRPLLYGVLFSDQVQISRVSLFCAWTPGQGYLRYHRGQMTRTDGK